LELASATFALQHLEPHLDRYGLARFVPLLVSAGYPTAIERLDQLGRLLEGMPPEGQFSVPYHGARAEHLLWNGRPEEALATSLRGLAGADPTTMSWYPIRLVRIGAGAAAEVAESGRAGRDQRLVEAARAAWEAFSDLIKVARAAGAFERLTAEARAQVEAELAMIQAEHRRIEDEPQVDAWRLAVEWLAIDGRPYPLAYARWRLAESLLVDGDRAAASKELRAAHRGTVALGAEPMRRAIENLAARARIDLEPADGAAAAPVVASTAPDDPFGLTPREREVLALVSTGRTNRQIADELFISESTAGVHVSNILGKLGVATRTEAASVAVRLNLDQA
jgi:DNA-binding CsgD family transcriptional regulator